jgi:hypothetical protein
MSPLDANVMMDPTIPGPQDLQHVQSRIEAATVVERPFPYLLIRDFLPDHLYRQALDMWPSDEFFAARNHTSRLQVNLARQMAELPESIRPAWTGLLSLADVVNRALYKKFTPFFSHKFVPLFGPAWRETVKGYSTSFRQLQLAQYTGKGDLNPHVDNVRLVVNSFLYASETAEPEAELGTVLYRSFGLMLTENNKRLDGALVKRFLAPDVIVPYQANCLLSFVNTPFSFHGVDPYDIGARRRRIMLFSPTLNETVEKIEADFRSRAPRIAE